MMEDSRDERRRKDEHSFDGGETVPDGWVALLPLGTLKLTHSEGAQSWGAGTDRDGNVHIDPWDPKWRDSCGLQGSDIA